MQITVLRKSCLRSRASGACLTYPPTLQHILPHPQAAEGGERKKIIMTRLSIRESRPVTARKDPTGPAPGSPLLLGVVCSLWSGCDWSGAQSSAERAQSLLSRGRRLSRPWISSANGTEVCGAPGEPRQGEEAPWRGPEKIDFGAGGIHVTLGLCLSLPTTPVHAFLGARARNHWRVVSTFN